MLRALLILTLPALITVTAAAQIDPCSLSGTIVNASGAGLAGVTVEVADQSGGRAVTRADGSFHIDNVRCGSLQIRTRHVGYEPAALTVDSRSASSAPLRVVLADRVLRRPDVIVTANRHATEVARCPADAQVVMGDDIRARRSLTLGDLLEEQTGLAIINDHGTGVQMQGMDAAYTLILVDGQPLIGRAAGTLDLDRVLLHDVERVEIVKGPTSSIYGSEALAGVINVITAPPSDATTLGADVRYGTHGTLGLAANAGTAAGPWRFSLQAQRLSSEGYDLDASTVAPTVAPFATWSVRPGIALALDSATTFQLDGRLETSHQRSQDDYLDVDTTVRVNNLSGHVDWSVTPSLRRSWGGGTSASLRLHVARYTTESELSNAEALYSRSHFDQILRKGELEAMATPFTSLVMTGGFTYQSESVEAERITGGTRVGDAWALYAQGDWEAIEGMNVTAGARYDMHEDYGSRISPKLALTLRGARGRLYASLGSGFKAPTVQQLYLDFTNPLVGYSVFGAMGLREGLERLVAEGQVSRVLVDPARVAPLRAESSIAVNLGGELALLDELRLRGNLFRNDISDMIETSPIAEKNNGQSIYSYFNLNSVITAGLDLEANVTLGGGFTATLGYQYLDAYEGATLERVRNGEITKVGATGRIRPVQDVEYGGLFNRSKHTGTARLAYAMPSTGLGATVRAVVRGRYGYADRNGNGILDDDSEYAPGYTVLNASLNYNLNEALTLYGAGENLLGTRSSYLPEFSGALFTLGVGYRLH